MRTGQRGLAAVAGELLGQLQRGLHAWAGMLQELPGPALRRAGLGRGEAADLIGFAAALSELLQPAEAAASPPAWADDAAGGATEPGVGQDGRVRVEVRVLRGVDDKLVNDEILPRLNRAIQRGLLETTRK